MWISQIRTWCRPFRPRTEAHTVSAKYGTFKTCECHWLPRAHAHGCPFHHFSACAPACGSGGDPWREWLWPSQRLAKAGRFPGAVWGKKIVDCQPNEFCHWSPWRLGKKPCLRGVELPCIQLVYELFQRPLVREVSAYGLLRVQQLVNRNHVCAAMLRSTFTDTFVLPLHHRSFKLSEVFEVNSSHVWLPGTHGTRKRGIDASKALP